VAREKRQSQRRGCTDEELVEVLSWADSRSEPADYIDFLRTAGVGPEVMVRGGTSWTLLYPAVLSLAQSIAERSSAPADLLPIAVATWHEGPAVFSTDHHTVFGFLDGHPEIYRWDGTALAADAPDLRTWLEARDLA
jgi:hypothetical protein